MSAVSMKHENREAAIALLEQHKSEIACAISNNLITIIKAIDECGGLIHEGNFNLFTRTDISTGNRVVYFYQSWLPYNAEDEKQFNSAVELYSDEGWNTLEDIANWADIAVEYKRVIEETLKTGK